MGSTAESEPEGASGRVVVEFLRRVALTGLRKGKWRTLNSFSLFLGPHFFGCHRPPCVYGVEDRWRGHDNRFQWRKTKSSHFYTSVFRGSRPLKHIVSGTRSLSGVREGLHDSWSRSLLYLPVSPLVPDLVVSSTPLLVPWGVRREDLGDLGPTEAKEWDRGHELSGVDGGRREYVVSSRRPRQTDREELKIL